MTDQIEVWCPHCEDHHTGRDEESLHEHIDTICIKKKEKREQKAALEEYLEAHEHVTNVRGRERNLDFRIGVGVWPRALRDDHLNTIASSSISLYNFSVSEQKEGRFVDDVVIHLPPAREELQADVEDGFELDDPFVIHFGTRALGGVPAPDGVITPHVQITESVTLREVRTVVEQALEVYETVYETGERAIKRQPER